MTLIQSVSVTSLRSHNKKSIKLHPKTTIIVGKNGIGKTSLLEAIYITLQGKSFKGSDEEILKHNKEWWKIETVFTDNSETHASYRQDKNIKEFLVNGKKSTRLLYKNKYPVVLFEPDTTQIVYGTPSKRRDYIDNLIQQVDPLYSKILSTYEKALRQRNNLLKQGSQNDSLYFPWDLILSEYGASIIARREKMAALINNKLTNIYQEISNNKDEIKIETAANKEDFNQDKLLKMFEESLNKDLLVKHTTIGPHRHDIFIYINDSIASKIASRGETRTIILALKHIESLIIEEITGKKPIILLDDVFSELDEKRQKDLLEITNENQTIITTTNADNFKSGKVIKLG